MGSTKLGIMGNNVIVPYMATTKRTKAIALTSSDVAAGANLSNLSFKVGYIIIHADSAGNWFAEGNFSLTVDYASASSWVLNIPNLVCKTGSGYYQEVSLQSSVGVFLNVYASGSAITIESTGNLSGNAKYTFVAFRLALNAEPTTYTIAANMEGILAADVYIAPASAGIAGLVNNVAGNTAGTPILGKTDGIPVLDTHVGGIKVATLAGISQGSPVVDTYYDDSGTLSLDQGSWDIILYRDTIGINPGGITGNTYPAIVMALRSGVSTLIKELTVASGQVNGVTFRGAGFLMYSVDIPPATTIVYKASTGWYKSTGSPTLGTVAATASNTAAFYAIRRA
jgi:hypothetical protein